ncbi:PTS sugar transporter subunit IIA [Pediococcus pentosaceus]|uniref:Protein-N(Pi)-phosphohistidine--sugar phosphotransferase n=1 Tax=Pediococcus pentosaceus TaxID=1255 RepID=A0A1Y0VML8_PEDPE|nr:PTS sugar transporter subunit IIA [Pediococcus pentosaceus]ARW18714.1 Protein-N(pi)-phosphohistidine--sugar phosphotransferase [Pediococcus pentosaceus]UQB03528.1 PTS sugar transporter subunit IIA [Pediococcus pentosaceus]
MKVILASHGRLALGMQDTLRIIVGETPNLTAYAAYLNGDETAYVDEIKKEIEKKPNEQFVVITDVLGGSVNTNLTQLLRDHENVQLIAGMNLPLVMELVTKKQALDADAIQQIINNARSAIVDINTLLTKQVGEEEL